MYLSDIHTHSIASGHGTTCTISDMAKAASRKGLKLLGITDHGPGTLAAMCNMSHSTFSMNFYRRYNMTCKEYITATRINAAENMLLFSSHDISFIAREVGYTDCSYFIRCYKKLKGVTPKQARKLQLGR